MLPPFGKTLLQKLPVSNDVYLFVGQQAWRKAVAFQIQRPGTLCLPAYREPTSYTWPVNQCDILVYDTGFCDELYITDLAKCLLEHGANIVRYVSPDGLLTVFKKDFPHA